MMAVDFMLNETGSEVDAMAVGTLDGRLLGGVDSFGPGSSDVQIRNS